MTAIAHVVPSYQMIEQEVTRVEDAFRRDKRNGRRILNEILGEPTRLSGPEKTAALDFGARLVVRLRERDEHRVTADRLRIWEDD